MPSAVMRQLPSSATTHAAQLAAGTRCPSARASTGVTAPVTCARKAALVAVVSSMPTVDAAVPAKFQMPSSSPASSVALSGAAACRDVVSSSLLLLPLLPPRARRHAAVSPVTATSAAVEIPARQAVSCAGVTSAAPKRKRSAGVYEPHSTVTATRAA